MYVVSLSNLSRTNIFISCWKEIRIEKKNEIRTNRNLLIAHNCQQLKHRERQHTIYHCLVPLWHPLYMYQLATLFSCPPTSIVHGCECCRYIQQETLPVLPSCIHIDSFYKCGSIWDTQCYRKLMLMLYLFLAKIKKTNELSIYINLFFSILKDKS